MINYIKDVRKEDRKNGRTNRLDKINSKSYM